MVLYHWTTIEKAEDWAEWLKAKGISRGKIDFFPDWRHKKRLYAWHNPVTGIVGGYDPDQDPKTGEFYAGKRPGDGLVLFKFELHPSAAKNHDYDYKDDLHFHEYHLLNPDIVERFTIDPQELKPEIEAVRKKLQNPEYQFTNSEVHYFDRWLFKQPGVWNDPKFRQVILQKLDEYLSQPNLDRLPKYFLDQAQRPHVVSCPQILIKKMGHP